MLVRGRRGASDDYDDAPRWLARERKGRGEPSTLRSSDRRIMRTSQYAVYANFRELLFSTHFGA
jgi:hypothetical protein